jgi:triosephosphate isomerase (TIM)
MPRYLIANWKMNLPPEGVDAYLRALSAADRHDAQLVVAPPFPYLREVRGVAVAAQNCADHEKGAFTGEVSPSMVKDCGATFVILGHSERRQLYGESDALIARKLALAIETGLTPVLCIGEDLRVRDAGQVAVFLSEQIHAVAAAIGGAGELVVAYEPIWAIGTGRNASGILCAETVREIHAAIDRFWGRNVPVLYGGSVTPENVHDLAANGAIDGFLVGGASLDSARFLALYDALRRT